MSIYTVHAPPLRAAETSSDPVRFVLVRDGFAVWAFLLSPLWMLWHRMWLALAIYLVGAVGLEALVRVLGGSEPALAFIGFLLSLAIGLEAGTLRRFTLSRRGWRNVGVVSGHSREQAERRFFDSWIENDAAQRGAGPGAVVPASATTMAPSIVQTPDVIGLFPEPGAHR